MSDKPAPNVLELLNSCTDYLQKRGIESPRLNAELLLAHVLEKRRLDLYLEFDRPLYEQVLAPMRDLLRKRGEGLPLQHLVGSVDFLGASYRCDARALVPRPETERMAELTLAKRGNPPPARVLELGVGSGVITGALARKWTDCRFVAVDQSRDALDLAAVNFEKLELCERIDLLESDGFSSVTGTFDLIISNPPYIATTEIATLSKEVRHDPVVALDGGPNGTELPVRWIAEAVPFLQPGGWLILEHGDGQSALLQEALLAHGYHSIEAVADYQETLRFLFASHG